MEFSKLNEEEFEVAALKLPCSNFYQTVKWGKLKQRNGWIPHFLGVKKKKEIIAVTLLLEKKVLKKYSIFYAPRGYLMDYQNRELLEFFTDELKKFAKNKKGIFIKIDPYLIHKERDIEGNIIPNGIDNSNVVENLKKLNYHHTGFNLSQENMQPRWAFTLNLEGKTEQEILDNMERKTRQLISKNERYNIEVREIKEEELAIFKDIMNHTSERRDFIDRPFEYYKNMLEVLKENAKIYITELNIENLLEKTKKEIEDKIKELKEEEEKLQDKTKIVNTNKAKRKIEELKKLNATFEEKIIHYQKIIDTDGKRIILGGIIFMIYNKKILSLFGGNYDKYKEFSSFYTLHWELIKYALHNGYNKYNFYGISGDFNNKNDELHGLYECKKGFGGQVEEYIGEFDLIINKFMYFMYKKSFAIYKKLKK